MRLGTCCPCLPAAMREGGKATARAVREARSRATRMPVRRLAWLALMSFAMLGAWTFQVGPAFHGQWPAWVIAVILAAMWVPTYITLVIRLMGEGVARLWQKPGRKEGSTDD